MRGSESGDLIERGGRTSGNLTDRHPDQSKRRIADVRFN